VENDILPSSEAFIRGSGFDPTLATLVEGLDETFADVPDPEPFFSVEPFATAVSFTLEP
jgi:hypothetical protein